jgi:hypothetical protein
LAKDLKKNFESLDNTSDLTVCDNEISQMMKLNLDTDQVIQTFTSAIMAACDTTFQVTKPSNQAPKK